MWAVPGRVQESSLQCRNSNPNGCAFQLPDEPGLEIFLYIYGYLKYYQIVEASDES